MEFTNFRKLLTTSSAIFLIDTGRTVFGSFWLALVKYVLKCITDFTTESFCNYLLFVSNTCFFPCEYISKVTEFPETQIKNRWVLTPYNEYNGDRGLSSHPCVSVLAIMWWTSVVVWNGPCCCFGLSQIWSSLQ